ncbi:armadillo-like helical domain-containing protein 2 [Electrophorus electricus]|uniref:armadillo-like helical domain-containing protein 2 n=1 Tax=Electrophorus electricus TaxID=8005 RepID=UPI000F0A7B4A|nr:armadillo-like helical domain-containing protein 2 [Electrophorus electricus]
MTKWLTLLYYKCIQPYLFPHDEESDQDHRNLHLRKIQLAGHDIQNTELPIAKRVDAAYVLGILSYTGGYAAAREGGEFMQTMVDFLNTPNLSDAQITTVLEGLSGVCHLHVSNQLLAHSMGLLNILQFFVSPTSQLSTKAKLWSCYLLNILCCNIPVIKSLKSSPGLQVNLESLQNLNNWTSWDKNYAEELLYILEFWPPSYKP